MDKSGVFVGATVGSISVFIIFTVLFIIPVESDETTIQMQNQIDAINNIILTESKTLSLIEIFEKSEPGVVRVNTQRNQTINDVGGVGSGFVFDKKGHIITNAHVIEDSTKTVVTFLDGRSYNAEIIGIDQYTDIGVIKVNADLKLLQPLTLGDSSNLQVGEPITAIGNPFGLSGSMTSGIISQMGRLLPQDSGYSIPDVIQTDAAINPGNSGGPLLNMKGEVVGMNTAIQSATGEFTGVGFAVPSNTIKKVVPVLIRDGIFHHPWMGISGSDVDPDLAKIRELNSSKGFLIATVIEGSPAEAAGLQGVTITKEIDGREYPLDGDIIIKIDDIVVRKISDILIHLQREKSIGDELIMTVNRDGTMIEAVLVLGERPQN